MCGMQPLEQDTQGHNPASTVCWRWGLQQVLEHFTSVSLSVKWENSTYLKAVVMKVNYKSVRILSGLK